MYGSVQKVKDVNGRLAQGKDEVLKILKEYFEDVYNIDTQEQVAVHMCSSVGIQRGNYFGGEAIGKDEVEVRVGKLQNEKATGKDELTGEMIKGGGEKMVDWTWSVCDMEICNMALLRVVGKIQSDLGFDK